MNRKRLKVTFIVAGILSIILALVVFTFDAGLYVNPQAYGGDAYTGIQNAGASTAYNVVQLSKIAKTGFASLLLVGGVLFIGIGVSVKKEEDETDSSEKAEESEPIANTYTEALANEINNTEEEKEEEKPEEENPVENPKDEEPEKDENKEE